MPNRKSNSFIKNFLVRREIFEQVKAGTCDLIDTRRNMKYILDGVEISISGVAGEGESE